MFFVKKQYFSFNQCSLHVPNFVTSIMSLSKLTLSGHIVTISHDCSHRGAMTNPKSLPKSPNYDVIHLFRLFTNTWVVTLTWPKFQHPYHVFFFKFTLFWHDMTISHDRGHRGLITNPKPQPIEVITKISLFLSVFASKKWVASYLYSTKVSSPLSCFCQTWLVYTTESLMGPMTIPKW